LTADGVGAVKGLRVLGGAETPRDWLQLVKYSFAIVSLYSCLLLVNHSVTHTLLGAD